LLILSLQQNRDKGKIVFAGYWGGGGEMEGGKGGGWGRKKLKKK
jgi:hypothetical protein